MADFANTVPVAVPSPVWSPISIDGGGYVTGMDFASDGTMVCRTDVGNAQVGTASTPWTRLLTSTSMPANSFFLNGSGNWIQSTGIYEIRIAPSNTQIFYMLYYGKVYKTTNQGVSWTLLSNFPSITYNPSQSNNGIASRWWGHKMAIHPTDPNTVVVGSPTNGLYYTTDGGASWTAISGITTPTSNNGYSGVCFDPATPTTVFACSNGNGVWQTTTGVTGTWTKLSSSGMPTQVTDAIVTGGNYICCDGTHIQIYSGTWAQQSPSSSNGYFTLDVDPANSNHIVALDIAGAQPTQSHDGGSTWASHAYITGTISSSGDVPWLSLKSPSDGYLGTVKVLFDPSVTNRVWAAFGFGVLYTDNIATTSGGPAPGGAISWIPKSAGIQILVGRRIISPSNGLPLASAEDCQEFLIKNPAINPSTFGITSQGVQEAGTGLDYAMGSPRVIAAFNTWSGNPAASGYSTDGGTTWTKFTNGPEGSYTGGNIAAASSTNFVALQFNQANPVIYTNNAGSTAWSAASGLPTFTWAFGSNSWTANTQYLCCDAAGTYFVYNKGNGTYYSTNGGANWSSGSSTALHSGSSFQPQIKAVPGNAGHLFYADGGANSNPQPNSSGPLWYSTNGGASMTWNLLSNIESVFCVGFGAAASGQTYPTVWIVGWVKGGLKNGVATSSYTYGVWVCKSGPPFSAANWTWLIDFPFGSIDQVADITGDNNDSAKCYLAFQGTSFGYGKNLTY